MHCFHEHIITMMHPLVRDLYKRVILVGRDYPLGLDYVRRTWKRALRDPNNCPSCYSDVHQNNRENNYVSHNHRQSDDRVASSSPSYELRLAAPDCQRELRRAVGKGRFMVREMIALIQLKKYRSMNQRYSHPDRAGRNNYDAELKIFLSQQHQPSDHDKRS